MKYWVQSSQDYGTFWTKENNTNSNLKMYDLSAAFKKLSLEDKIPKETKIHSVYPKDIMNNWFLIFISNKKSLFLKST